MSLKQQLTDEMKQAMRDRNAIKLGVIRFLISDIKNTEIDQGELDDSGIQKVVAKQIKSMKDAIEEFKKGDRQDIVDEELQKVAILETFLPPQLSDEELLTLAKQVKDETGLTEIGRLIGAVKAKAGDGADGKRVADAVKQVL
jgi:hypothetical protein